MKRLEKSKIICIAIIIIISCIVYYFITKEDEYLENNFNLFYDEKNAKKEAENNLEESNINTIIVYITGAVNKEGIYEIKEKSRIADVIEKAEGLTEKADIKDINLAYTVEDGMKIHIPQINENKNLTQDNTENYITREKSSLEDLDKTNNNKKNKVNINTATQTELETLPGIGPTTALKIIKYRKENGGFKQIEEIKNVDGIGENKFLKVQEYIEI